MDESLGTTIVNASNQLILGLSVVSGCVFLFVETSEASEKPPNILFILTDQQRQDGIGAYGKPGVQTPNIDRLAGRGIRFDRAYVAQPVCSPNRASILTGQYPHTHGVVDNGVLLPNEALTLAEMLAPQRYDCAYFGKWHLDERDSEGNELPDEVKAQGFATVPAYPQGGRGKNHYFLDQSGHRRYAIDVITEDVIAFLKKPREGPFFAFVSYFPPHPPYAVPQSFEEMYRQQYPTDDKRRIYYAMCSKIDEQVGRLLSTLDQAGMTQDTLVVYTSEHGHYFEYRWNSHPKRLCYDIAARVPLVMSLPGVVPPNQATKELISSVDLAPTVLGLVGQQGPEEIQGKDLSALARGVDRKGRRAIFIENRPILRHPEQGIERCVRDQKWKLILSTMRRPELYDMEHDPNERDNLWSRMRHSTQAQVLKSYLREWGQKTGDELALRLLQNPGV